MTASRNRRFVSSRGNIDVMLIFNRSSVVKKTPEENGTEYHEEHELLPHSPGALDIPEY